MRFSFPVGTCQDCGKQQFVDRKSAKSYSRRAHPGERFSIYRCGEYFHYGHIPYLIARGVSPRDTYN